MSSPEAVMPHAPTSIGGASIDPARRRWLRLVVARCVADRCTEIVETWRQLRGARRTGRGHRRGGWRRLAHAAASLLLVLGGMARGLALPWPVEAATIPFTMRTIITNFNGAFSVTHADLDHDGDLDVVATAVNDDAVVWWENDGTPADGGWVTHTIDAAFDGAQHAVVVDLDRDGHLDVVGAAQAGDDVTWWESDGSPADGGWVTHTIHATFDGAFTVAAADLDGDGDVDVLGAAQVADDITWWESDGTPADGGWVTHTIHATFTSARMVLAADVNGDGALDVLGTSYSLDDVTWWENDGTPADGGWTTHTIAGSFDGAFGLAVADLDRDGALDVIGAAYWYDDVTWWENDGTPEDGGWTTHTIDGNFAGVRQTDVADLDGDGDVDVFGAAVTASDIIWWENDGTPADGGWTTHSVITFFDGARWAAAADLDGDGDLDLTGAAQTEDDIAWWENRTIHRNALLGGTIPYTHTIDGGFDGAISVTYADLDGDGDLDALGAANAANDITWWANDGTPANGGWTTHTIDASFDGTRSVTSADLDGDGDVDVVAAANFADDVTWWENDGTPGDGGWTTHTIDASFTAALTVATADVDGDGDVDVLGAAVTDLVTWWENDGTPGDGGWTTHTIDAAVDGAAAVTTADLDGDGDMDVLGAAAFADDVVWWANDGTPADGGWITHTIEAAFDNTQSVVAADLDGDGDLDVLGTAYLAADATWWENDGTPGNGGWTTHTISAAFPGAYSAVTADLDADGDLDVLGAAYYPSSITWWQSDGSPADGGWITHTIDGAFYGARSVAAADFDRDGDLDILGAARYSADITWWQNKGGQFTLPTTGTAPATLNAGQSDDFLTIVFTHNGRTGDNDEELTTLQLRFEDVTGTPDALTTAEANAIVADLKVYVDANASGTYDAGTDTLVATVGTLALDGNGDQIVTFTDADANAQLSFATGTRTYFAVLDLASTLSGDPARNGVTKIRMTHITEASSTAEDRVNDLPLGMAFTSNSQSSAGGTTLQGPLAVTITLLAAEPSGGGRMGWLLGLGALGAAVAAWRRRLRR